MDTLSDWLYAHLMNTNARGAAPQLSPRSSADVVPLLNTRRAVTRAKEIATWVREMAEFTTRERAPTELLRPSATFPRLPPRSSPSGKC
jgi:hypothetical protein